MAAGDNLPFRGYAVSLMDNGALHGLSGLPVVWGTDTIKAAFLSVQPDYDDVTTDLHWADVSVNEVSSVGTYAAGGVALVNATVAWDTGVVKVDADDVTVVQDAANGFTNATWVVLYKDTGVAATSPLLILVDLGSASGNVTSNYVLQWGATGILRIPITNGV